MLFRAPLQPIAPSGFPRPKRYPCQLPLSSFRVFLAAVQFAANILCEIAFQESLFDEVLKIVIQINGKVRGEIEVENSSDEELIKEKALKSDTASKWLEGNKPKKVIYVPGRLINFVV